MNDKRVTQSDVAKKCGVNRATVSLALKEHPSIPPVTRDRVRAAARQLGYVPDPMLSALAAYRGRLRPSSFHGTLAWITRADRDFDWRAYRHFVDYFEGAKAGSKRHGFTLETINVSTARGGARRVGDILRARNISGVLLCPQPSSEASLALPWPKLSAVTFGYTLTEPRLHTVAATQFRGTMGTMREFHARGYQRVGFVFESSHNQRTDENYLGGYLAAEFMAKGECPIPPLLIERYAETGAVGPWMRKYKLDAILTGDFKFLDRAKQSGLSLPPGLGVACPLLPAARGSLAGMCEDCFHIGEVAVDLVVAIMNRGERGVPQQPQRVHVEGRWFEGTSLRAVPTHSVVAAV